MSIEASRIYEESQAQLRVREKLIAEKAANVYEMVTDILQDCHSLDDDGFLFMPLPLEIEGKRGSFPNRNRTVIVKVSGIKGDWLSGNEGKQKQALRDYEATISITGLIDERLQKNISRLKLKMSPMEDLRSILTISPAEDDVFTAQITPRKVKSLYPLTYHVGAGTSRAPSYEEIRDYETVIQGHHDVLTSAVNSA